MAAERDRRVRRGPVIGAVFAVATLLFVWGALSESDGHHDRRSGSEGATSHSGETAEGHSDEPHTERGNEEFKPLGVGIESTPLVLAAAVVSLFVAAMVAWHTTRGWLLAVVILGIAFVVLEVAEVAHQIDEENTGLLLIALAACATHAVAAVLAGNEVRIKEG